MLRVLREVIEQVIEHSQTRDSGSSGDYRGSRSFCSRSFLTLYVGMLFQLLLKISCLWIGLTVQRADRERVLSSMLGKKHAKSMRKHLEILIYSSTVNFLFTASLIFYKCFARWYIDIMINLETIFPPGKLILIREVNINIKFSKRPTLKINWRIIKINTSWG